MIPLHSPGPRQGGEGIDCPSGGRLGLLSAMVHEERPAKKARTGAAAPSAARGTIARVHLRCVALPSSEPAACRPSTLSRPSIPCLVSA